MKFYKLGVNASELLKCNHCGRELTQETAYLAGTLADLEDEFTDVFCKTCKDTWMKREKMELC